jgi:transaldolase
LGRRTAHATIASVLDGYELLCHRCHERAADRPNLFIKSPAAHQGPAAIAACLTEEISINVTLIFSLSRYGAVMDA